MALDYRNPTLPPAQRAEALLAQMTDTEKIAQLQSLLFMDWRDYEDRDYTVGHVRDLSSFLPEEKRDAANVAHHINEDTRRSVEASRFGIPVLQNGEALHGAQWGRATTFPQVIGLAAAFDPALVRAVADAVARELRAVGVRMVFAPVVNVVRDCRWGRTEETFGESVLLNARLGVAYVRGLEENGVIAAPKHFVDNYASGGRDSNASLTSWRELREVYLEPFYACFTVGGARSVMMSYNSVDGVPCSYSRRLMQTILRDEWGFDGFTISDYNGVEGVCESHRTASDMIQAQAMCLNSGLDVQLPNGYALLSQALEQGLISTETLDTAVSRVLKAKIELGLMEQPYVDPEEADRIVLCPAHIALAEKAAEKSMVLLKNQDNFLPLSLMKVRRIGVFGPGAAEIATGGYSGCPTDILTPLEALKDYLQYDVEVLHYPGDTGVTAAAADCDVALYFASILEGEGTDRSDISLPDNQTAHHRDNDGGIIVNPSDRRINVNQHRILRQLQESNRPLVVILLTGAPVDTEDWGDYASAILQAWYPGQRGGQVIARTLFGDCVPGGKLPICFPQSIGQVPLHHDAKPSGRGYGYIENSGSPRYPFGFGLSYTTFALSDFSVESGKRIDVHVSVHNTGTHTGDEVVQLYVYAYHGSVVRPVRDLKDFARVTLVPCETANVTLSLNRRALSCCNVEGNWELFDGWCDLLVGTSSTDITFSTTLSPDQLKKLL